jgi:hypothetical protein
MNCLPGAQRRLKKFEDTFYEFQRFLASRTAPVQPIASRIHPAIGGTGPENPLIFQLEPRHMKRVKKFRPTEKFGCLGNFSRLGNFLPTLQFFTPDFSHLHLVKFSQI